MVHLVKGINIRFRFRLVLWAARCTISHLASLKCKVPFPTRHARKTTNSCAKANHKGYVVAGSGGGCITIVVRLKARAEENSYNGLLLSICKEGALYETTNIPRSCVISPCLCKPMLSICEEDRAGKITRAHCCPSAQLDGKQKRRGGGGVSNSKSRRQVAWFHETEQFRRS